MIDKFISGLSDLGKKLLVVALIVIIVTLFDRLLIEPTMSRLLAIDEEIGKEEKAIKVDLLFLSYKDKILKETQAIEPYLTDNVPTEDEIITSFLKKIEVTASKTNVVTKTSPPVNQQDKNYLKYSADVDCSGKLTDVITFMHLINTSDELMKVVKFNLGSKKADSDEVKATLTIARIIISKKNTTKTVNPASGGTRADASNTKTN
ncbi:MAG: hypothetical protein WCH62_01325 [Candidatus Omnitrophota bacterium]